MSILDALTPLVEGENLEIDVVEFFSNSVSCYRGDYELYIFGNEHGLFDISLTDDTSSLSKSNLTMEEVKTEVRQLATMSESTLAALF